MYERSLQYTLAYYGRRFLQLIYIPIVLFGVALLLTSWEIDRWSPVYRASATLMLNPSSAQSRIFPFSLDTTSRDRIVQSYVTYLMLPSFAQLVQDKGALPLSAEQIHQSLIVESIPDTFFLRLTVQSSDRMLAQQVANTAAKVLVDSTLSQVPHDVERDALITRFQSQLTYYEDQTTALRKALDEQQQKPIAQDPQEQQNAIQIISSLRAQLTQTESLVVQLLTTLATLRSEGAGDNATVAIIDEARVPVLLSPPSRLRFWLFALVASQVLGVGVVVLLDYLFPRFRTEGHAARVLELVLLGSIPVFKPRYASGSLVSLERPNGLEAELFRLLATTLTVRIGKAHEPVLIQVTSAMQREGKSQIVGNLAVVLSELGHRVLVIDADLRHPIQHEFFRRANTQGLATIYSDEQTFDGELIQATDVAQVYLLSAGPTLAHPAHFIASARLRRLFQDLRMGLIDVDLVLFDSPPLLSVSDAAILVPHMDAVVFVVDLQHTEQRNARRAQELLVRIGVNPIGLVMNRGSKGSPQGAYSGAYRV